MSTRPAAGNGRRRRGRVRPRLHHETVPAVRRARARQKPCARGPVGAADGAVDGAAIDRALNGGVFGAVYRRVAAAMASKSRFSYVNVVASKSGVPCASRQLLWKASSCSAGGCTSKVTVYGSVGAPGSDTLRA